MAKIIIVDDDQDDIYFFRKACDSLNPTPEIVALNDGLELLNYIHENSCDQAIILLDLNMPKMGGIEVLTEINQLGKINDLVLITYSTSNHDEEVKKCYELGVKSYLTKPDNHQELSELVTVLCKFWFDINHLPKLEVT